MEFFLNIEGYLQGKNKKDLEKIRLLVNHSKIDMRNFGMVTIDLKNFSWMEVDSPIVDNNFWWQLQGYIFFTYFSNSHSLLNKVEKKIFFDFFLCVLKNWKKKCFDSDSGKLLWHDHATGLRTLRLAKFYIIGKTSDFLSKDDENDLEGLILKHLEILSDNSFYSENTNHGFDQSVSAYATCLLLSDNSSLNSGLASIFSNRIVKELDFAFTDEGVHVENSPSYQNYMLGKEKVLDRLVMIGDKSIQSYKTKVFGKAKKFLEAITKLDGLLPTIGDTDAKDAGIKWLGDGVVHHDYSRSGYYIYKRKKEESVYLAIKNCHHSKYHRHDDNGSFYLEIQGVVVFGDGGLGYYKEKNPLRKFLRSVYAHNVVFSKNGKIYRDPKKLPLDARPRMSVFKNEVICDFSDSEGKFQRVFDLNDIDGNKLTIVDSWDSGREVSCNFFIPHENVISVEANFNGFSFFNCGVGVRVSVFGGSFELFSSDKFGASLDDDLDACFSPSYSVFEPCQNVVVSNDRTSNSMVYVLEW
ncbi:hypothetical protein CLH39_09265 [Alcaligenes faecalis]|nr:hypothetical protein CLH39_09265 [Alcaligenes faecalis]